MQNYTVIVFILKSLLWRYIRTRQNVSFFKCCIYCIVINFGGEILYYIFLYIAMIFCRHVWWSDVMNLTLLYKIASDCKCILCLLSTPQLLVYIAEKNLCTVYLMTPWVTGLISWLGEVQISLNLLRLL